MCYSSEASIGAFIFTAEQASKLNLIDDELNLEQLINKIIKENNLTDYKVIKMMNAKKSLVREILTSINYEKENYFRFECLSIRSSMTAILNYESIGC